MLIVIDARRIPTGEWGAKEPCVLKLEKYGQEGDIHLESNDGVILVDASELQRAIKAVFANSS